MQLGSDREINGARSCFVPRSTRDGTYPNSNVSKVLHFDEKIEYAKPIANYALNNHGDCANILELTLAFRERVLQSRPEVFRHLEENIPVERRSASPTMARIDRYI